MSSTKTKELSDVLGDQPATTTWGAEGEVTTHRAEIRPGRHYI